MLNLAPRGHGWLIRKYLLKRVTETLYHDAFTKQMTIFKSVAEWATIIASVWFVLIFMACAIFLHIFLALIQSSYLNIPLILNLRFCVSCVQQMLDYLSFDFCYLKRRLSI